MCIRDRDKAAAKGVKLLLPVDSICAAEFAKDAAPVEAGEDLSLIHI